MDNKEIIEHVSTKENLLVYAAHCLSMHELLNLARQDEREKCLKILAGKMFELQFMFNKVYEKTYQDRETLTLPELQQRIADIADVMQRIKGESEQQDEREKMQGVEVWDKSIIRLP